MLFVMLGIGAGAGIFFLYQKEKRIVPSPWGKVLTALRIMAVAVLALILSEPVLSFRKTFRQKATLVFLIDTSESMSIRDSSATPLEKISTLKALGELKRRRSTEHQDKAQLALEIRDSLRRLRALIGKRAEIEEIRNQVDGIAKLTVKLRNHSISQMLYGGLGAAFSRALQAQDTYNRLDAIAVSLRSTERELEVLSGQEMALQNEEDKKLLSPQLEKRFDSLPRLSVVRKLLEISRPGERFSTQYLAFDDGVRQIDALPEKAEGKFTDIASALKKTSEHIDPRATAGIVLITDGRITRGRSPDKVLRSLKNKGVPVYCVGVGTENPPKDIVLESVNAPASAFKGDLITVEFSARALAFGGEKVTVQILTEASVLKSSELTVPEDGLIIHKEQFKLTESGKHTYEVKIYPLADELRKDNNSRSFTVSVREDKLKVLYAEGRPRWEFRYLKNAFERDKNIILKWEIVKSGEPFPLKKDELYEYDLVLLGDLPISALLPSDISMLKKFVAEYGGSLVLIAGESYMPYAYIGSGLEELLPVRLTESPLKALVLRTKREGFKAFPSPDAEANPITILLEDLEENRKLWEALPRFYWHSFVSQLKPGASSIIETRQKFGSEEETYILLALHNYGIGKVVYAGTDEFWRWRWKVGDLFFHRLWSQVIRWCAVTGPIESDKFVKLSADKSLYSTEENIIIRASVKDERGLPLNKARLVLRLKGPKESTHTFLYVPGSEGRYLCRLKSLEAGEYTASVVSPQLPEQPRVKLSFTVISPPSQEAVRTELDRQLLENIAFLTDGEFIRVWELPTLASRIKKQSIERTEAWERELWSTYPLFLLFVSLLVLEWSLRKKFGLL